MLTTSGDGTVRVWPADGLGEPVVLLTEGGAEVRAAFSLTAPALSWVARAAAPLEYDERMEQGKRGAQRSHGCD